MKKLKLFFSLLMLIGFGVGNVWGSLHTTVFDKSDNTVIADDLSYITVGDEITWNLELTVAAGEPGIAKGSSNQKECLKFGSSKSVYFNPVVFSTDYFEDYNVTSVKVYVVNNGKKVGTFTAQQGDVTIGSESLEFGNSGWTVLTATGAKGVGGTLKLTYEVDQAFYISSIEVTYDDPDATVCDDPVFSVPGYTFYDEAISVELSCSTSGAAIHYTLDGTEPSAASAEYEGAISISATTTIKAVAVMDGLDNSNVVSETYTKGELVTNTDDLDFEAGELAAYPRWTFENAVIGATAITPHGGSYYATTGGKGTATFALNEALEKPGMLQFYTSKESTNTTASSWKVQVSSNGEEWTDVEEFDATAGGKGEWTERSVNLSAYPNSYVRIRYEGSTATRAIDDITWSEATGITVAKPVISAESETFEETLIVSITCATEGASIHFTLDGTDPTENSEEYSEPFEISETTTVKAIAFLEDAQSSIASTTYTKVDPSALISCAEVYGLDDNTEAKLNEVTVTYVSGKNVWVKDASGAVFLFMESSASFAAGAKLQGVAGKKTTYKGLVELTNIQLDAIEATAGEAPAPEELSAIDENKDMSKYVILKNVAVSGPFDDSKKLTLTLGNDQYELFNKFSIDFTFDAAKTYDVRCIVSKYNTLQLNFVSAEEAGVAPVTVAKPTFEPTGTTFTESITVSITCETEGATIRYTLDGTDPTANSLEYSEPFEISETTTVKAIAFLDDAQSDIASITYTKKADPVVPGDCYTLTFTYYDKTDGDGGAKLNTKEAIFDEASQDYIDEVLVGTQVYAGRKYKDVASGDSIFSNLKLGTGTAAAQLKFALANPTEVEKIIFRAAMYSDTEGAEGFTVNDSEPFALSGGKLVFADYEWIPEGEVSTIDINQVKANKGRFYLTSITICPKSDSGEPAIKASDIDLGEVKTEDDVYETELTLEVKGENLDSPIAFESSNSELVAVSGQLDETGGTLTVNISVPATEEGTVLNETITLTSGNVVKEVAVTAIVKKVVPVIPTGGFVKVTEALNDWEGTYLIVYEEGSVALDGSLEDLDAVGNVKAVTITEGTIEATEEMLAIAFTVTADADNEGWYQLKSASGYYIAGTKASANASNGLKSSNDEEAKSEYLNQPGVDEMLSKSADQNMTLRFNKASNQNRFRYYKSGQEPIALYKLSEASDEPAILAANIALGEIETESDVYETELTLTVKGKNLDSPIAFESSNSEIVAVSGQLGVDGGTLTVNIAAPASEEGTELNETITLTSDNVVKVVSVTAVVKKVVPVPPTGKKYILADIENIAPDQSVIIAMETNYGAKATINVFAMSVPENASTAPAAVSVTAEDGAIITDATDIFWNIVKDEDGNYLIYPDGTTEKWLYCTTSNNGVRVGNSSTATAKTFDIQQAEEAQGGGMYLHNIGNNRYLGIYNSADWRCYGSVNNNIKNQNLRLYVYSGTTAIDNTEVMEKATKFIQNGHLFIIKGDRIYNVMGQIIR